MNFKRNITIKNCIIKGYEVGLGLSYADYNSIFNNRFENNTYAAFYVLDSKNNTIEGNILSNNSGDFGAFIFEDSPSNIVINNMIVSNSLGWYLYDSPRSILRNNSIINNTYNFIIGYASLSTDFGQDIDSSNKINNKSIYYISNMNNQIYSNLSVGYLAIASSSNVTVRNMALVDGPLFVLNSTNISIVNNNFVGNFFK